MSMIKIETETFIAPCLDDNGIGFILYRGEGDEDGHQAFVSYEEMVDDYLEMMCVPSDDPWLPIQSEDEVMAMVYDLQRATDYLAERFEELRGKRLAREKLDRSGRSYDVSVYGGDY